MCYLQCHQRLTSASRALQHQIHFLLPTFINDQKSLLISKMQISQIHITQSKSRSTTCPPHSKMWQRPWPAQTGPLVHFVRDFNNPHLKSTKKKSILFSCLHFDLKASSISCKLRPLVSGRARATKTAPEKATAAKSQKTPDKLITREMLV